MPATTLALSAVGAAWSIAAALFVAGFSAMMVVYALNEFRIWRLRRRGLDRCRFCGTMLTTIKNRMDMPIGFMSVCPGCGREQGPWSEHAWLT
jgi:hypothetical protein